MKFRCLALTGLLVFSAPSLAGADPASDAARHIRSGDYAAAAEGLLSAGPPAREQVRERFLYATALAGLGEHASAAKEFESLIADYPDNPEPYNNLAALYAAEGKLEQAKDVLERAIRTDERYAAVYGNLSAIYVEMARAAYAKALRVQEAPPAPDLRVLQAMRVPAVQAEIAVAEAAPAMAPEQIAPEKVESVPPQPAAPAQPVTVEPVSSPSAPAAAAPAEPETPTASAGLALAPAPAQPAPAALQPTPDTPAPQPVAGTKAEVTAMLEAWASAWSGQDVDAYLAFYAPDFTPPRGALRADWEDERGERLMRPEYIEVRLEDVQVRLRGDDKATVRLVQSYRSPGYQDRARKAFSLVRHGGRWLIGSERTLQVLP